jgi:RHS repeat-associated protein
LNKLFVNNKISVMIHKIKYQFLLAGMMLIGTVCFGQTWNPAHKIATLNGSYHFSYNQTPSQLIELYGAAIPNTGLTYQWEQSTMPISGFAAISGATASSYSIPGPLTQNMYYRRKTTSGLSHIYSNTVKISVVSVNWEDVNYLREHDVQITGITSWTAIDQMAIGDKLQVTSYLDGLGRAAEVVNREAATPGSGGGLWGDIVQFAGYDLYGRETTKYLPYTTTTQSGKYKTTQLTEQPQYYTSNYNETSAFSNASFDNSPLDRVSNIKLPGTSWAAGAGKSAIYEMNSTTDDVQLFDVDYTQGNAPVHKGAYTVKTLYKSMASDENGKQVIEYFNKGGQLILKKVQLDDSPASTYNGWLCTYYIYDDFGLLRYEIQPEGVKYLAANSWSFAGVNGQTILNEQCFQYYYDDKGRTTWKKSPGAQPSTLIYDSRGRIVFAQDGNQATAAFPQWTTNLYDDLDRLKIRTLYTTTKTIANLQSDIALAPLFTTATITNPGTVSVTATLHLSPLTSSNLNNSFITKILKYNFYDNYSFNAVKAFNTNYTNTTAYSTSDPNVIPIATSLRTTGMQTGSMTRVLGGNVFLSATHYFDEGGSHIQTLDDNLKGGVDVNTVQYHFDSRVLSTCVDHTTTGTGYTSYKILTKYLFDKLGRVTTLQKQFGSNAFKTIAGYTYDDMGRPKVKTLDPGYTAGGNSDLESLTFNYNIHGQLIGINKDYALKNPANYNKWGHFFGQYLGFDNRDNVFTNANLSGRVTGVLWNTLGDDAQRKYDYSYDNAGRLVNAVFAEKQHTGDAWSNASMDFSVSGTSGKITYDLNGNLLNMLHKGVLPGTASPITVDNLSYTYASYSNKLQSVTDAMTNTTVNGAFGDFKDGVNGAAPDYVYDANGNVVIDLNKSAKDLAGVVGANGIKYNFLDKPEEIRVAGKGTIKIVYSANGQKLQRRFTSETQDLVKITTYINQFIYDESTTIGGTVITAIALTQINFEEGRIRVVTPTTQNNGLDALVVDGNMDLPNGKRGVYDYFIMDYQQNVRMVLSEEIHTAMNTATLETNRSTLEESIFGQPGGGNEVLVTRYAKPSGWSGNTTAQVSRLGTNSGHNIGPNTLQKVMAGDKVTATVAYYHEGSPGGNNTSFVNTFLGSLAPAIVGGSTSQLIHGQSGQIQTQLNGTTNFINAVQPNGSNPSGSTPQAFLTILFFDERFNFIAAADGGVAQQQVAASVGSNGSTLGLPNVKAPKNGYAYIYISNQSNNHVYFDDLQVGITQGNIAEENHYYAYGLKIATLSSRKLGDIYEGELKNNYLYQGANSEMDDDIGWNDFVLRNYDAQIGRWVQQDPYQEFASPYLGMGDDPVNLIDPSGGNIFEGLTAAGRVAVTTLGGAIIGTIVSVISGDDDFTGAIIGAAAGLVGGISSLSGKIAARMGLTTVTIATTVLNGATCSAAAGAVNDVVKKSQLSGSSDKMINQILKDVLKLKAAKEAWDKGHSYPGGKNVEYSFDVTEDESCFYAENLDTKGLRGESPAHLMSRIGKAVAGQVHIHTKGALVFPSDADLYVLKRVVNLNPKFGNFVLVIGEESYYAIVITDPDKAKRFYDNSKNYDRLIKAMFDKNIRSLLDPKNNAVNERKFRKAWKKILRKSKRNGIRLYKAKKTTDPNFKRQ